MTKTALIGHTGFVGGFLKSALPFTDFFNSKNIDKISGHHYDTVVCAGISAVKWLANKEPQADKVAIEKLKEALKKITADRFVHISTIDVFKNPRNVDETTLVDMEELHPYGLHRYQFELFLKEHFENLNILRLPALFGPGLRKNALYDLLHNNQVENIPRKGVFQWYDLRRLPDDMERVSDLSLVHFATEPLSMQRLIERLFQEKKDAGHENPAAHYDFHTIYADRFKRQGPYMMGADEVLASMREWVASEKEEIE